MKLPVNYTKTHYTKRKAIREEYAKRQGNLCWYCKELLNEIPARKILAKAVNKELFPKGFFDYPVHLHHDHNTHMTIGAVHAHCNAVMWQYYGQ